MLMVRLYLRCVLEEGLEGQIDLVGVLDRAGLRRPAGGADGRVRLLATDSAERFARVGGTFLGRSLQAGDVEVVDL